jgi:hypothetical protein
MSKQNYTRLTIWFDDRDSSNKGWAYTAEAAGDDYQMTGQLPQRRPSTSLQTLRRSLAKELGNIPAAARADGNWSRHQADHDGWTWKA